MNIYEIETENELENDSIDQTDLMNYLCQVVLSMTDEEIKNTKHTLNNLTKSVKHINATFKEVKQEYDLKSSEFARERQLERVLTRIETLNKEGSLRGQRRTSIIEILPKLKSYSFSKLSRLEEQISIF